MADVIQMPVFACGMLSWTWDRLRELDEAEISINSGKAVESSVTRLHDASTDISSVGGYHTGHSYLVRTTMVKATLLFSF